MKTVLVTGSNGFVGQHLIKELADNGLSVVGVAGPHGVHNGSSYLTSALALDLTRPEAAQSIDFEAIYGVIHLAGLAAMGPSFDNPMEYLNANLGIETNLFEAALAQDARPRFLIISTGSLYHPKAALPLTETSPVLPSSPYAVSKLGQEQMAQYYQSRGFESIIARPFNHIGPGQNEGFIVPDLAKQIVEVETGKIKELLVGNLDAKRDYTDVRDIALAYRLLLERGTAGEIYNICSGFAVSGHEILASLLKNVGKQPYVKPDPERMRPSDTPEIYGSHEKLTKDTGWQPQINLDATISNVLEDWRQRQS